VIGVVPTPVVGGTGVGADPGVGEENAGDGWLNAGGLGPGGGFGCGVAGATPGVDVTPPCVGEGLVGSTPAGGVVGGAAAAGSGATAGAGSAPMIGAGPPSPRLICEPM
jgi:hypothetical protein